jgi:hypothetical protein
MARCERERQGSYPPAQPTLTAGGQPFLERERPISQRNDPGDIRRWSGWYAALALAPSPRLLLPLKRSVARARQACLCSLIPPAAI